jgi:hypothetical protein
MAPALAAYAGTPAAAVRRAVEDNAFPLPGDPVKMVQAMLEVAERQPAPKRVTLGSGAYAQVHAALSNRLAELEAQQAIAFSTDIDQ